MYVNADVSSTKSLEQQLNDQLQITSAVSIDPANGNVM